MGIVASSLYRTVTSSANLGQESGGNDCDQDGREIVEYGNLALSALAILRRMRVNFDRRDKRSDYLNSIRSSVCLLEKHLALIKQQNDFQKYESEMKQLAYCLKEFFRSLRLTDESHIQDRSPFLVLKAVTLKHKDFEINIKDMPSLSNLDELKSWKSIQNKLEQLTDELEQVDNSGYTDNKDSKLPDTWLPPDEDACDFFRRAFDSALCKCGGHSMQSARLSIRTYRQGPEKPKPKTMRFLFPWEKEAGEWLELHIRDET